MNLSDNLTDKLRKIGVMKIAIFVLVAIAVGGCIIACAVVSGSDDGSMSHDANEQKIQDDFKAQKEESVGLTVNDIEIPWKDMGYASFEEYHEEITALHEGAKGMSDEAIEKYSSVITDEQKSLLKQYEQDMVTCMSPDEYEEALGKFNEIVSALEPKLNPPKSESNNNNGNSSNLTSSKPTHASKPESSGSVYTGSYSDFMRDGVIYHKGNKFTYYSERVLSGGGLNIPGRHTSNGFVRDGDGYIVLANDKPIGTVVETPWGMGKVYDRGTYGNHYDIYVA